MKDNLVRGIWLPVICILLMTASEGFAQQSVSELVAGTPHNLSITGPSAIVAQSEARICVFCHTPHSSDSAAPLWNRYETTTNFAIYPAGGSMQSVPGQPNGASRICLSCHDGTTALGMLRSQAVPITMFGVNASGTLGNRSSNIGISLADDHPVSFVPNLSDTEIQIPMNGNPVRLDPSGQIQCTSCHDPHNNSNGSFLVATNTESALCLACHNKADWAISRHGHPSEPQFAQLISQGCESCHSSHGALVGPRLLNLAEEDLCLTCHDGIVNQSWEVPAEQDLASVFLKASIHPVQLSSAIHNPGEGPINSFPAPTQFLPEEVASATRHVECADCHNPHSITDTSVPGEINGALNNMWGVTIDGNRVSPASHEYEICLKCHGDSQNLPAGAQNKRLEFALGNPGFHPVFGQGLNPDVPSLLPPWTEQSTMECSDCHGNNDPLGAQGPHGSDFAPLLRSNYFTGFGQQESPSLYALCYSCHDRDVLYSGGNQSFKEHDKHVLSEDYSCFQCHSSHGSQDFPHLLRFDATLSYIEPSSSGQLEFISLGVRRGMCYIKCHGEDHDPEEY